jgi:putative mycofactocin binding protein MftB
MKMQPETRYKLAPGSQVREEDFGLLFYTMAGPRLYFLSCGGLLNRDFFTGDLTLETWMSQHIDSNAVSKTMIQSLKNSLNQLQTKGVIIGC